jgi:outer membrane protein with beta-barrel domain
MKLVRMLVVCAVAGAVLPQAWAQKWEFGGGVGGGFYSSRDVTAPGGSAAAKIQTNLAGSAWLGNTKEHWGGELRYDYQTGDLQLSQGSNQAVFGAKSQAFHYDLLLHLTGSEATIRPFVAAGAGIKIFHGTGTETAFQPLSDFALLTKAQDLTPLVSVGGGVKIRISSHAQLRLDVHDYLTPFPKQVIAPAANAKLSGWLQDIVPMAGLAFLF